MSEPIALRALLWMTVGNANLGGPGRIALLRAVRDAGSITAAAKARGMSYKGAWDAIDMMNRLSGEPLVVRATGGRGGGSTRLTERGAALIERYEQVERLHRANVEAMSAASQGLTVDLDSWLPPGLDGLAPAARVCSSRDAAPTAVPAAPAVPPNRLSGIIDRIERGRTADEIELRLPGKLPLVARLAPGEAQRLGLRRAHAALAMLPASAVMLSTGPQADRLSARNRLEAVVTGIHTTDSEADSDALVVLALAGDVRLMALVTTESLRRLGLVPGLNVVAAFEASQLIVVGSDTARMPASAL